MPGYDNRFVTLKFPALGEGVFVTIRNPRVMPASMLRPEDIAMDANGQPVYPEEAERATNVMVAKLVRDWHVYDATSDEDEQPVLDLPATPESVAKLPLSIYLAIAEEVGKAANPS